jgi:outer membrane protein assembly factor BamD
MTSPQPTHSSKRASIRVATLAADHGCPRGPGRRGGRDRIALALVTGLGLGLAVSLGPLGCAKTTPTFEDVPPADELYAKGLEILEGRQILYFIHYVDYDGAIEKFQAIIDNYPYSEYELLAQLKIADTYFEDERYEEALAYYQDFADLHPQNERVPYALLRAALCHFNQISSIDHDQKETKLATESLDRLMTEHPYAEETREAEVMMIDLRTRLALHMIEIADFYRDRTHWQSAASRYRRVIDEYPGLGLDARALYNLGWCLEKMRREDEALRLYHVVVENYGDTPAAREARARIAFAQ